MKANIHPDYHEITIVMTDGKEYKTRSTYGKAGDIMRLDVDPLTHPAWNGGLSSQVVEKAQLSTFDNRYGGFITASAGAPQPAVTAASSTPAVAAPAPAAKAEEKKADKKKK